MYREPDEVGKLKKRIEDLETSIRREHSRATCYLIVEFETKTPGQFNFQMFNLRTSAPWHGSTMHGYSTMVFFATENDTYEKAQEDMVKAAQYLAPLMKKSLWPAILEWMKERGMCDDE